VYFRIELYITFLSRKMYFLKEFIYLITKAEVPFDTRLQFHRSPRRHTQKTVYPLDNTVRILNSFKRRMLC
jgi:hypothetical protein